MKRVISMVLALIMVLSPFQAFAAGVGFEISNSGCDFYNLIEKNDYALASGATESEIIINDDTGANRNVMHVIEVDLSDDNISVMPTYMGLEEGMDFEDNNNWQVGKLTEQAAHVENNLGLNVVGGINTNLRYDSNHPYGVLVWNGVVYSDERNSNGVSTAQTYLVVDKDGNAELRGASEPLDGTEWQAISANFGWILKDGVNQYASDDHADANRAPRTVIGIKEDGKLVLMMNDGRQAPYSAGMTMRELAEVLLAMGCVDAVNCDGGGSSTFISEREGTGELTMKSSPSDGGQRATLGGLLVVSKAVADGNFDHATVKSTEKYVTPNSTVEFTAVGADSAGGPAELPDDIEWQMKDPTFGVVEDGVFTSSGKTGEAVVQMTYNGEVVGEGSVNVVIPSEISFAQENITVPFGKTAVLNVRATVNNGLNTVTLKESDIRFELSNPGLGTINGFEFTAVEAVAAVEDELSSDSGTITAILTHDESVTTTANIQLGRGSEIVWDFEDGDISALTFGTGYANKHAAHPELGRFEKGSIEVVDSTNGQVKHGKKALAVNCDWSGFYAMGYNMLKLTGLGINMKDAVGVGFWIYLTPEATGLELDLNNAIPFDHGTAGGPGYEEDGWYYVYATKESGVGETFNNLYFYHTDGYDRAVDNNIPNIKTNHTVYIDDITVDYSTVVEDREAPEFTSVGLLTNGDMYEAVNGQTVKSNTVTLAAEAKENTAKNNYTGLDRASAKVYVDGVELTSGVSCASNGTISADDIPLEDGIHTFKFVISDNAGNERQITRQLVIDANNNEAALSFVPQNPELDKLPVGSIYWMDLKAEQIETIDEVTTTIDLDGSNDWVLEQMVVANGFEAEYTVNEHTNAATVTIKKTGNVDLTGNATLVSIPIHVWEFTLLEDYPDCVADGKGCNMVSTPETMRQGDGNFRLAVCVGVEKGEVEFVDGTTSTFSSEKYVVDTEMDKHRNLVTQADKNAKKSWHIHTPVAIEDKKATCTEVGYIGRTVCAGCSCGNTADNPCDTFDGCGSVVDWGTTIPKTGHSYKVDENQLVCSCGDIFSGNGLVTIEDNSYYLINGKLVSGWQQIDDCWYYFNSDTKTAHTGEGVFFENVKYTFDSAGKLTSGTWVEDKNGTRYYYGPTYYRSQTGSNVNWVEIDGVTYGFDQDGYRHEGISSLKLSTGSAYELHEFALDGKYIGIYTTDYTGLFESNSGKHFYLVNGAPTQMGLIIIDGAFYYINSTGTAVTGKYYCSYNMTKDVPVGEYTFDADGKMLNPPVDPNPSLKNGIVDGYYYVNDVKTQAGLVKIDGDYYYIRSGGRVATSCEYYCTYNMTAEVPVGMYKFDADGKMINPPVAPENPEPETPVDPSVKNGIVDGYYYVNDVKTQAGLIKIDGNYYYIRSGGKVASNCEYYCTYNMTAEIPVGMYKFDAEGRMLR